MSENNICEQCGGYTSVTDGNITYQFRPVPPGSTFHLGGNVLVLCPGHPEPAPKHDGKLDGHGDATASYGKVYHSYKKEVQGVHIDKLDDGVCLDPQQALSLLAWLRQEESALEQLVKEQEG